MRLFFFFKQKTAYEMRISDWSSDVCSSDLPKLEIISSFGVGYDPIDIDCAKERKVVVTNTPDVLTDDVADIAMALMLAMMRRIPQGDAFVRQGRWLKDKLPLTDKLGGKIMGVVGLGRIGQAIARRAEPFGVEIRYFGPRKKADIAWQYYGDLVAMARDVDILMIACPGGRETEQLVNAAVIDALGSKGYIRSEEHTSELQSLMRISYAVFCLKKKNQTIPSTPTSHITYSSQIQRPRQNV